MNRKIIPRRDTIANWTTANPVLADGELAIIKDTGRMKFGDGINHFNDLAYFIPAAPSYTVSTVPTATGKTGAMIFVSNEAGGAVIAFSDGTNWRRVTDRAIIS